MDINDMRSIVTVLSLVAFVGIWFFSITDRSQAAQRERELFLPQFVRSQTGLGASGAVSH